MAIESQDVFFTADCFANSEYKSDLLVLHYIFFFFFFNYPICVIPLYSAIKNVGFVACK